MTAAILQFQSQMQKRYLKPKSETTDHTNLQCPTWSFIHLLCSLNSQAFILKAITYFNNSFFYLLFCKKQTNREAVTNGYSKPEVGSLIASLPIHMLTWPWGRHWTLSWSWSSSLCIAAAVFRSSYGLYLVEIYLVKHIVILSLSFYLL